MDQFQSGEEPGGQSESVVDLTSGDVGNSKDVGFVGRLFGILYAPGKSFAVINGKWDWLLVIVLLTILGFGALMMQRPYLAPDIKKAALENIENFREQMGEEQYQETKEKLEKNMDENFELSPKTAAYGFIAHVVSVVIIGLLCWLVGNFMSGGKAKFWQVLAVVAFAGMISLLHDYVRGGLMTLNGTSYVYLGLGLLKPDPDSSFMYYFLRQFEFITMWKLAAMAIALGALYKIPASRFAYVLVPAWVVFMALVAVGNLFAGGTIIY